MQIFRRMEAGDIKVDVVAYNSAIAACAKGGDWEQAWAVFSSKCSLSASNLKELALSSIPPMLQSDGMVHASADTGVHVKNCLLVLEPQGAGWVLCSIGAEPQ